ncbi:GSCOCG00010452001-RA-CDS [Cotesia congregata]|uniref:Probable deoxycytidylate deaminase n=1 Tax=Cotesia congregata TaxID=51543 RepID=A0A8J2HBV6_COTCN|nr:GSCOCG00010452001-RA-CDS [Cotesia congregata]CAG5085412.1 Similar to CG6951: Probable deoxycytidylate deaminase (Drosophila melanogaster) [Cotesia congregata]
MTDNKEVMNIKDQKEIKKRDDVIGWDDLFMGIAFMAGTRSKDPCTQVGACIVDQHKRIVSVGYNGMPEGCHDDKFPWGKDPNDPLKNKHTFVCHAELNAILNRHGADIRGSTIFVSLFPCNQCAKLIIQSGLKEIVYYCDKHAEKPSTIASKMMLDAASIKYRVYVPEKKVILVDLAKKFVSLMTTSAEIEP